jgi:hypothetical protein
VVQLSQEGIAVDAVDHAGLFDGLTPGAGAAQAVHADSKEQGSSVGSDIQHGADDSFFFNSDSHNNSLLCVVTFAIITSGDEKNKRENSVFSQSSREFPLTIHRENDILTITYT